MVRVLAGGRAALAGGKVPLRVKQASKAAEIGGSGELEAAVEAVEELEVLFGGGDVEDAGHAPVAGEGGEQHHIVQPILGNGNPPGQVLIIPVGRPHLGGGFPGALEALFHQPLPLAPKVLLGVVARGYAGIQHDAAKGILGLQRQHHPALQVALLPPLGWGVLENVETIGQGYPQAAPQQQHRTQKPSQPFHAPTSYGSQLAYIAQDDWGMTGGNRPVLFLCK